MPHYPNPKTIERVGEFVIDGVLGRGGMGVVLSGTAPDGTRAAIKLMHFEEAARETSVMRFRREAQIRIDHPNVVKVLDAGQTEDGHPFIALELLKGETLLTRIRRSMLGLDEAIPLMIQICRGLVAVHAQGVIHRDLKPGNVFLEDGGGLKLLDFGVARFSEGDTDLTQGAVVGTPSYLSPEQARGHGEVDPRSDLWAVGVLLYELLTSKRPFRRDSALTTMMAVVMDEPLPVDARVRGIPEEVVRIVHRCLEKSPRERFQTAEELGAAFAAIDLSDPPALVPIPVETIQVDVSELSKIEEQPGTVSTRPSLTTIAPDEQRLVAVVLALGAEDQDAVAEAIEKNGGAVIRLMGGQIIGVFGGQKWEGDELQRAARLALEMRPSCEAVAMASGRAFQQGRGLAGVAIDRAEQGVRARLEGVAIPAETARALRGEFAVRAVSDTLAEITRDAETVELATPPVPAMVGRDHTLSSLCERAQEAFDTSTAGAAVVFGPLGSGKTRLRQAFVEQLEIEDAARVFYGRADPRRRDVAFQAMSAVLFTRARLESIARSWPDLSSSASVRSRRDGIAALIDDVFDDPIRAVACKEFLGELLGIPVPESTALVAARDDAQLMNDRLRMALIDYFQASVERGPVVLILEDVQWSDDASISFVTELLDELAFSPFFLVVTGRPELEKRFPNILSGVGAARYDLEPLRPAAATELANAVAGRKLPRSVLEPLVERADGNPLFIAEIVRAMVEDGNIDDSSELPLPLSVEAAIQARLDNLDDDERFLVRRAAFFGGSFTAGDLAALGVAEPSRTLRTLARRGLVAARSKVGRGREFRFKNTLFAEVAYQSVNPDYRRELHRRIGDLLSEAIQPDPERLAYHLELGDEPEKAAQCYADAALAAERRGDSNEVLRCSARTLELGLPARSTFSVRMARADAKRFLGDLKAQHTELVAAVAAARSNAERSRAHTGLCHCEFRLGRSERALTAAAEAVRAGYETGDADLLARALGREATLHVFAGRFPEADERLVEATHLVPEGSPHLRALLAEWRGLLASACGDIGEQVRAFREAVALHEEVGDVRRAAGAANNVADALNRVGDFESAEAALREAVAGCRRVGNQTVEGYALVNLAYALTGQGRRDDAVAELDKASELAEASSDKRLALYVKLYRVRLALQAAPGRIEAIQAANQAESAAKEAEQLSLPGAHILALTAHARAMLLAGYGKEALEHSAEALRMRDEIGSMQEDEAEVFLTHAKALIANGHSDEALEVLKRGRARVRTVGSSIGDPELRARFLTNVPAHIQLTREIELLESELSPTA